MAQVPYNSPATIAGSNLSAAIDEVLHAYSRVSRHLTDMVAMGGGSTYTAIATAYGTPQGADQGAASGLALYTLVNQLNGYMQNARDAASPGDRFGQ